MYFSPRSTIYEIQKYSSTYHVVISNYQFWFSLHIFLNIVVTKLLMFDDKKNLPPKIINSIESKRLPFACKFFLQYSDEKN